MPAELPPAESALLAGGTVIPAHPLALDANRRLDERAQRALTRYYLAACAGGVAVGVHSTQFAIREVGLLGPVLRATIDVLTESAVTRPFLRIAGACGELRQAVEETELAASLGYHAVLLSPSGTVGLDEQDLLVRAKAVGEVLPVIGFYLQEAVGGRHLSVAFWRQLADLPCVVAVKIAPFDRYRTLEAIQGITQADRGADVVLYTGNDDAILTDLLTPFTVTVGDRRVERRVVGGLLGQWAIWTRTAVELLEQVRLARAGDDQVLRALFQRAPELTAANGAVFDAANNFLGCIPGINHVLHRQGLLGTALCIDPDEKLSPGQLRAIEQIGELYPWLPDDEFVLAHREEWLS